MKKIFTLMLIAICAMTAKAQEPLYTINATVAADPEWGEDYASYFALQGTKINIDVYEGDYVIIRNWAGAEGCDLKIEYDSSMDVDEYCDGNIIAITSYINGVEQTPLTYEKEEVDEESGETVTYSYFDFATGREDYPVASASMNEDGTFYNSFIEIDHESKSGYIFLTAYFMSTNYSESLDGYYYNIDWEAEKEPTGDAGLGTYMGHVKEFVYSYEDEETGKEVVDTETYGVPFLQGFDVKVDVCDGYLRIYDWSNNLASPRDIVVTFPNDDNNTVTGLTYIANGTETDVTKGGYIYTGYSEPYPYYMYAYASYSNAGWDEDGGYALITGYTYTRDPETGEVSNNTWGHYYVEWEPKDLIAEDGIATVNSTDHSAIYNLAGQRVSKPAKGIFVVNGKKVVVK